VVGVSQKALNE